MTQRIKYILEEVPKTPIVGRCFAILSILVPILIGVVVGVHFWDSIDADLKFPFVIALVTGTIFLTERFLAAACFFIEV